MMPAEILTPREFVSDLNNALTLLQSTHVHLLPLAPELGDAWPAEDDVEVFPNIIPEEVQETGLVLA